MVSPSSCNRNSIDYESIVDSSCVEELEESDRSTELPVIRTSFFKNPVGQIATSPQSLSCNEKARMCPLEKVTVEAHQEVTRPTATTTTTTTTTRTITTRSRSTTASSWSSDSTELSSIAPLSETNFPSTMPRIAFADWQKFGIELFTPKPQKLDSSSMYYKYHSVSKTSTRLSDRPRNGRSNSQPTPKLLSQSQPKPTSQSIFDSDEEEESNSKPKLLLRRATLEGYYCPENCDT